MPNMTKCNSFEAIKESNTEIPITLSPVEMFGLFLLIIIGLGISLVVFGMENIWFSVTERNHGIAKPMYKNEGFQ